MVLQHLLASFCIALAIGVVACQAQESLQCYNCDPVNNNATCWDPEELLAPQRHCDGRLAENETYVCVAFNVRVTNDESRSGVARSCEVLKPDIAARPDGYCDFLREQRETDTVDIVDCVACNNSLCNSHVPRKDGTFDHSAAASLAVAFPITMLLVCYTTLRTLLSN